jgi:prepilin signal peptidase PulO-like enzyme (type II secretory pathway)
MVYTLIYFVVLGLIIGSFLNVVAYRIPRGESIVRPPSHCPHCHTRLRALDLVPMVSWLMLRGRCRHCCAPVHWQYPVVEAVTGLLLGGVAWRYGWSWETLLGVVFVSFLVPLSVIDLREMLLPNVLTFPLFGMALLGRLWIGDEPFWMYAAGSAAGAGTLLFLAWLSPRLFGKEGMGLGDVKLMAGIGLMVGLPGAILTLFAASLTGVAAGFALRRSNFVKEGHIPFGPFLSLGAVIAYLYGDLFITWYLDLLM